MTTNLWERLGDQQAFPDDGAVGLDKLEWFAGMAMQGLLAARAMVEYGDKGRTRPTAAEEIAENAVRHAKALLVALATETQRQRAAEKARRTAAERADTVTLRAPTPEELADADRRGGDWS